MTSEHQTAILASLARPGYTIERYHASRTSKKAPTARVKNPHGCTDGRVVRTTTIASLERQGLIAMLPFTYERGTAWAITAEGLMVTIG